MSHAGSPAKPLLLAMVVAGVFVGGIGVGMLLSERDERSAGQAGPVAAGPGVQGPSVRFDGGPSARAPDGSASGTDAAPGADSGTEPGGSSAARTPVGTSVSAPPPPPPPIPPEALADAERMQREREARGPDADRGDGKVTTLVYEFDDDEERQAWEERYKQRWETRLKREIDIKIRQLREKIGLSAPQESELRTILDEELKERARLVELLTAKTIGRSAFDEAVRDNVSGARQRLRDTLTAEQFAAYQQLKPREQVLRDETK